MITPRRRLPVALCLLLAPALAAAPLHATDIRLPGATAFDAPLQARLRDAWRAQAADAAPRTSHRNPDGSPRYINRLILASSPYLRQHAHNPVNWYPWGEEAFAAARRDSKPIFLSIGYSTCHWCHVMEHECFENEAIAAVLNQRFIAIKVDREERPDVDAVYIEAVQRMAGGGGWPLSVFLTPDLHPFYGGTYFPPEDRHGRPGFGKLLATLADAWATKREQVVQAGAQITASLQAVTANATTTDLSAATLRRAFEQLAQRFDAVRGGFGGAPKFPQAHMLQFLLRYWQRTGEPRARQMAEVTLDRMARGGIYDQLGGGFHRYATDPGWLLPHFEKMLYDQAINARAYLEAFQATRVPSYASVARDIFAYVLRDLAAPDGGFYAAEDADSEGEEGRFYLWSRAEMSAALGDERGALVADYHGIAASGRVPLSVPAALADFAGQRHLDPAALNAIIAGAHQELRAARARRPRPLRDEKIITAWNGLMISSLAYGSAVLGDPRYAVAAARAADVVLARLQRDGRVLRSVHRQSASGPAYLDDYACFILGLGDLYEATFDVRWLREAERLTGDMLRLFAAPEGGLHYSAGDHEALIARPDDAYDGALPAAQSVAALTLLRLGRLLMNSAFESAGSALLGTQSAAVAHRPVGHTYMLLALDFMLGPTREIVVAGPPDAADTTALLAAVRQQYVPRSVLALHAPGDAAIEALVPFVKQQTMRAGRPTVYVCENYVCKLPTSDPQRVAQLLAAR